MISFKKYNYPVIFAHLLFWCLCIYVYHQTFFLETIKIYKEGNQTFQSVDRRSLMLFIITGTIIKAVFVYITFLSLLPRANEKSEFAFYILLFFIGCLITEHLMYLILLRIEDMKATHLSKFMLINLLQYVLFSAIGYAYFFLNKWKIAERIRLQLEQNQLQSELNFLRTQLNPHFLFNVLNNMFSVALESKQDVLAKNISSLGAVMRYLIYESNDNLIALSKEAELIESTLNLYKLKWDDRENIKIEFIKTGNLECKIAPLVLITFVENALKYGIDVDKISFIKIDLAVTDNNILFSIENSNHSVNNKNTSPVSGIGLKNVKRRLELLYPGRFKLHIKETDLLYQVLLEINI